MKILITGAGGMLGTDLAAKLQTHFQVTGASRTKHPHLTIPTIITDLTDALAVRKLVQSTAPDIIFHAAAMTDVDGCEKKNGEALKQNFEATKNIVDAITHLNTSLIHFSTDYVFDGTKRGEYLESDSPAPLNVYGETKLLAEKYIQAKSPKARIFRVSWLFGKHGKSFPRTILERSESVKAFEIVNDQFGRPTYTCDLAEAFSRSLMTTPHELCGVGVDTFHLTNSGEPVSWYGLTCFILNMLGRNHIAVNAISTQPGMRPALRPKNSVLALSKAETKLKMKLPSWQDAIARFINAPR